MEAWQRRVVAEKLDLDQKREKLRAFMLTPKFHALKQRDQDDLRSQAHGMMQYSDALGRRIRRFP